MATTPTIPIVDRIEPTKARLTWPSDATTINTWYAIHLEGSATAFVDQLTNHDPGHHSNTPEWMTTIPYIVGGLTPATTYRMFVRMHDGGTWQYVPDEVPLYVGGSVSDSPVCEFTTAPNVPHCPLNAHLMDKSSGSVTLRCAHSTDANAQGTATKYGLFTRAAGDTTWPLTPVVDSLTPVTATVGSFVTATYAAPTTGAYDYCFRACNAHGWSEPSNTMRITADGGPTDVATFTAFKAALNSARPGDIVKCTAAMTMDTGNTTIKEGTVVDLGGFTHEYTYNVATNRVFLTESRYYAYGVHFTNGTVHIADTVTTPVYVFVCLYGADGFTLTNVSATGGAQGFAKLDSQSIFNGHCGIYGTTVDVDSTTTVVDIGPKACTDGVVWDHTHTQEVVTGNSTSADGLANEVGYGFWDLRSVTVDGVMGDGIDLKFVGDYYTKDLVVKRAVRNSTKVWGVKSSRGIMDSPKEIACGKDAVFCAGNLTVNDGLFEGYGYAGDTGHVEGAALSWGNGRMDNGLPGYGGLVGTFNHCNIRRRMPAGAVQSAAWLTFTDGGDSNPLEPGGVSTLQFNDCLWYSAGTHTSIIAPKVKAGSVIQYDVQPIVSVIKSQAIANNWPTANHNNSLWLDEDWSDTVVISNAAPVVNVPNAAGYVTKDITLDITATDSDGTVSNIDVVVKDSTGAEVYYNPFARNYGTNSAGVLVTVNLPVGTYTVTAVAYDNEGKTGSDTGTIVVAALPADPPPANLPPIVSVTGETTGYTGSGVYGAYLVSDPDGDTMNVTYGLAGPAGSTATLNTPAQTWEFFPDKAGTYTISVSANDGVNPTVTGTRTVTVTDWPPVTPPPPDPQGDLITFETYDYGTVVGQSINGTMGGGAPYWQYDSSDLLPGGPVADQAEPSIVDDPTGSGRGKVLKVDPQATSNADWTGVWLPLNDLVAFRGIRRITVQWDQYRTTLDQELFVSEHPDFDGWYARHYGIVYQSWFPSGNLLDDDIPVQAGKWQTFKTILDFGTPGAGTVNVTGTIDGVPTATATIPVTDIVESFRGFNLTCFATGRGYPNGPNYFDNIRITGVTITPPTPPPPPPPTDWPDISLTIGDDVVMGYDPQRHRIVLSVAYNASGETKSDIYTFDKEFGGWDKLSTQVPGVVTARATAEQDADAYLVMGNIEGSSIRVFDPDNAPVEWEWRSKELTGADFKAPGATFVVTGVHVDWHKANAAVAGSLKATLFVDGVAMPEMSVAESTSRVYVYGNRARGHRFSLCLVGNNAEVVSARYLVAPGRT
jgi:hypothetical protein